jgi:Fe2+ or Zn2+ uptake regulation protein
MTRQRALILEIIKTDKKHYTAEKLWERAKLQMPGMSFATVYNNLHALERDGMIRKITAEDGSALYDYAMYAHGHLYCTSCSSVENLEIPSFSAMIEETVSSPIDSYELKVRYICPACRKKTEKNA